MRLLHASAWDTAVDLCNSRRVGVDSLTLSRPVDTDENIPMVVVELGASALDRTLSAPRGVAAVAAESDGGMLANTRNSTRFA